MLRESDGEESGVGVSGCRVREVGYGFRLLGVGSGVLICSGQMALES